MFNFLNPMQYWFPRQGNGSNLRFVLMQCQKLGLWILIMLLDSKSCFPISIHSYLYLRLVKKIIYIYACVKIIYMKYVVETAWDSYLLHVKYKLYILHTRLLSIGFSESSDCHGINLVIRTCKTNKAPAVVCRPAL